MIEAMDSGGAGAMEEEEYEDYESITQEDWSVWLHSLALMA